MQPTDNRLAYEYLKPVVHDYREEQFEQHRGKAFAHYQEHEDGTRTVTLPSGDQFHRNQQGLLSLALVGFDGRTRTGNYPMFVNPHTRYWHNILTAYHRKVIADVLEVVRQHHGNADTELTDAVAIAAHRHAHRIHGGIVQPGPYKQRAKHLAKTIYKLVDPDLFSLMLKVTSGYQRASYHYNLIAALQDPHDVPKSVLAAYISLSERDPEPTELAPQHDAIQVTQVVRSLLEQQSAEGLPRRAWRYLLRMRPRDVAYLIKYAGDSASELLIALADTGEMPRQTALHHLVSTYMRLEQLMGEAPRLRFTQYARVLARETHKKRGIRAFIADISRANLITDWLATNPNLTAAEGALPLTWWRAQAQAWHDDPDGPIQLARRHAEQQNRRYREEHAWMAPLREQHARERAALRQAVGGYDFAFTTFQHAGVTARALTTPEALETEGNELEHCVGGYDFICIRGASRIFALEGHGTRSTLEMAYDPHRGTWRIQQLFAKRNSTPAAAHQKAAKAIERAYNEQQPHPHADPFAGLRQRQAREEAERRRAYRPGRDPNEALPEPDKSHGYSQAAPAPAGHEFPF